MIGAFDRWQLRTLLPHLGLPRCPDNYDNMRCLAAHTLPRMALHVAEKLVRDASNCPAAAVVSTPHELQFSIGWLFDAGADPLMPLTIDTPPTIYLPPWARIPVVAVHEATHLLLRGTPHGHDPLFAAAFAYNLDRFGVAPLAWTRDSLDDARVRADWGSAATHMPYYLEETKKWQHLDFTGATRS